jgi:hypothetical protein
VVLTVLIAAGVLLGTLGVLSLTDDEDRVLTISTSTTAGEDAVVTEIAVEDDVPLTDREIERATSAAVEIAGGGQVSEIDRSDDAGEAYEVEVLTDAGEVDIALDENFERVPNLRYDD